LDLFSESSTKNPKIFESDEIEDRETLFHNFSWKAFTAISKIFSFSNQIIEKWINRLWGHFILLFNIKLHQLANFYFEKLKDYFNIFFNYFLKFITQWMYDSF